MTISCGVKFEFSYTQILKMGKFMIGLGSDQLDQILD